MYPQTNDWVAIHCSPYKYLIYGGRFTSLHNNKGVSKHQQEVKGAGAWTCDPSTEHLDYVAASGSSYLVYEWHFSCLLFVRFIYIVATRSQGECWNRQQQQTSTRSSAANHRMERPPCKQIAGKPIFVEKLFTLFSVDLGSKPVK